MRNTTSHNLSVAQLKELQTEHQEAVNVAEYLEDLKMQGKILLFSHIPHETYTKHWGTKMKNKREGVRPGVPDYIVVTKSYVLFIELKRRKNSSISAEQKEWLSHLKVKHTDSIMCRGSDEVEDFVKNYIHEDGSEVK